MYYYHNFYIVLLCLVLFFGGGRGLLTSEDALQQLTKMFVARFHNLYKEIGVCVVINSGRRYTKLMLCIKYVLFTILFINKSIRDCKI